MAGSYPDPPNNRFAYDIDGSGIIVYAGSNADVTSSFTATQLADLNSDIATAGAIGIGYGPIDWCTSRICVVFPEPRTITHVYVADNLAINTSLPTSSGTSRIYYSTDTVDGLDGTWTESIGQVTSWELPHSDKPRTGLSSVNWTSVRGVAFYRYSYSLYGGTRYHSLHLYGDRPTNLNRLAIWHPTLDVEVSGPEFDFGNVYRGLASVKDFRVKNLSSTKTANDISITVSANGDYSPAFASMFVPAPSGITSLAPGEISSTCSLTGTISTTARFASMSLRLVATASTWT